MPARKSEAQARAKAKYDQRTARQILFRFNRNTDADVLARLEAEENMQGYIKALIRRDIEAEQRPTAYNEAAT